MTNRSRVLRSRPSSACETLWAELRDRRLGGLKFVREQPIGPYFTDFICRAEKVVVEVDGGTHGTYDERRRDEVREAYLRARGYRVFRAHNAEIYENVGGVCDALLAVLRERADSP